MFVDFANFYRRFIRNFSTIVVSLTSILQKTGNNDLGVQTSRHKENQDAIADAGSASNGKISRSIKNLSTVAKLAKSKKLKLTKPKKSDLIKAQNFAKANSSRTDFLTSEAKKVFIHLQKNFTKTLILKHFDLEYHIRIKTDALEYAINGVLSQMTSN